MAHFAQIVAHNIVLVIHEVHELGIDPIFGERVNATKVAMRAESLGKLVSRNIVYLIYETSELGIEAEFWGEQVPPAAV